MGLSWSFKYWPPGSNMKKVKELNLSNSYFNLLCFEIRIKKETS